MTDSNPARDNAIINLVIRLGLLLSVCIVYAQVSQFDFIDWDDNAFVFDNPHIRDGLTIGGIRAAFASETAGHWVPITVLSHSLMGELFGTKSGMHHLANVALHLMASLLLFAALHRATGDRWPSAFVAFVFALHPLHVESVAWVSERKDVLSTFFWFLALYEYVRYAEQPNLRRYLLMALPFWLGLMSKSMLVTFPFTLILLDVWPLQRVQFPKILWEKLPLITLSICDSLIAYITQRPGEAIAENSLTMRIGNSLISYVVYIGQMFWPTQLTVIYPFPESIQAWKILGAFGAVVGISAWAIFTWRTRPYIATGWFWYLGTLVPVIGLVELGYQSHADHFIYVPMVGLLVMLAWGSADVVERWRFTKPAIAALALASCITCMVIAQKQTTYWQNTETLFNHAIAVDNNNWVAHCYFGMHLLKIGQRGDAVEHFEAAIRIKPNSFEAQNDLAWCMAGAGLCDGAIPHFEAALRARPNVSEVRGNLGHCLLDVGRYDFAIAELEAAIRGQPSNPEYHYYCARALAKIPGRDLDAVKEYQAALSLKRDSAEAHHQLAVLLIKLGRSKEAIAHFEAEQRLHPDPNLSLTIDQLKRR